MSVQIREPGQLHADEAERLAYWRLGCECDCLCDAPATHYRMAWLDAQYLCRDCFNDEDHE